MNKLNAEIISVGTELLMGSVVNTNATYIARRLAEYGVNVFWQAVVGDNAGRLTETLSLAFSRADLVITTGGLGPTDDDLTKEAAAAYFGLKLIPHEPSLAAIEAFFKKVGKRAVNKNKKQGYFPEGAVVLPNSMGTAPGCLITCTDTTEKTLILLPGPPREMQAMFESGVVPYLKQKQEFVLISRDLRVVGIGESAVAEAIDVLIKGQSNPTIATFASENECVVRITAKAKNIEQANELIAPVAESAYKRLGRRVYAEGSQTLEEVVAGLLTAKKLSVTFAESCTGGLLAGRFVNAAGVSQIFKQSFVTYSNEAKQQVLGVGAQTLAEHGAVSEQTVAEMAEGAARAAQANVGVAVTGIAGPGGATTNKPVGLVWIGVYINGKHYTEKHVFAGDREWVRKRAVISALDLLRVCLRGRVE